MYDVPFEFVIDTNSYAGNFERELCAYVTGYWDNETHGGDQAEVFEKEIGNPNPFEGYVTYAITRDDDVPVYAPQCIEWESTNKANNSVGIFFEKEPTPELITLMKKRAKRFTKKGKIFDRRVKLKILGFRFLRRTVTIREEIV